MDVAVVSVVVVLIRRRLNCGGFASEGVTGVVVRSADCLFLAEIILCDDDGDGAVVRTLEVGDDDEDVADDVIAGVDVTTAAAVATETNRNSSHNICRGSAIFWHKFKANDFICNGTR